MKPTLYLLLYLAFCGQQVFAQATDETAKTSKTLVGVNITTTLAGFFNSGGQNVPKDPFLFSIKTIKGNKAWRYGAVFSVDAKDENVPNSGFRQAYESSASLRVGREWIVPINKRFAMYYGADIVLDFDREKLKSNFFEDLESKTIRGGAGIGPVLGIYFMLGDRVRLSTETYAYAMFYGSKNTEDIGFGIPPDVNKSSEFSFLPSVPNSLYIHFSF